MKDLKEIDGDWVIAKHRPAELEGDKVVDQRIKRLIRTAKATLFYTDDFGVKIGNHVNSTLTGNKINQVINELKEDIALDPAVKTCEIEVKAVKPLVLSVEITLYSGKIFSYDI